MGFCFPNNRKGVISDMTLSRHMERRGLEARPHGFRTSLRTWLAEATDAPHEVAEAMLAHTTDSGVVRAYRRTDYLEQRAKLAERWADHVTGGTGQVVKLAEAALMARDKTGKTDLTPAATSATSATQVVTVNYQEAVNMAKSYFNNGRYWNGCDLLDATGHDKSVKKTIALFLLNVFPDSLKKDDARSFEFLREAFASKILEGDPIPEEYRELAASFVMGEHKGPRKKPGAKAGSYLHEKIIDAVEMLCEHGMTATRNDESPNKDSACDAVAEALRQLGLRPITFKGVKGIWTKRGK
jgi:hypothetical protein